jgi:signal peptidase I
VGAGVLIVFLLEDDSLPTYGPSMRPTLESRSAIDIETSAYEASEPRINDIVAAQGPAGLEVEACAEPQPRAPCAQPESGYSTITVVKRIVGLPGDEVAFAPDGTTIRNGRLAREPFIRRCGGECGLPRFIVVPAGHYFLAGDNRPVSSDSRYWGPVPREAIDGRVILPTEQ